ncbi:calmodulin-2 [Pieris brassicae]|uniref:calmodulin-2 n=1 Tax=Pieris brassicae TaxID=7116 RepID=UPI001E662511|nr:calmodulin-2 [Pieris brassicae]
MEEDSAKQTKTKSKERKDSRGRNESDAQEEIKKIKKNLLQSVADGGIILGDNSFELSVPEPRARSGSKAREALEVNGNILAELDENKIFELKEAFLLFDLDGDGCIDHNDLRGTFISLGENVDEHAVSNMLSEATNPLDFDAFVNLLGFKTLELDSEEILVTALSRWDPENTGYIPEARIRHDLMTWGDRFTEKEAEYALDEAPMMMDKNGYNLIDYKQFCRKLCGLKKTNKQVLEVQN